MLLLQKVQKIIHFDSLRRLTADLIHVNLLFQLSKIIGNDGDDSLTLEEYRLVVSIWKKLPTITILIQSKAF